MAVEFLSNFLKRIFPKRARCPKKPTRKTLQLEQLEDRTLLSLYVWTGANNNVDLNWSDRLNWLVNNAIPLVAPGASDDVRFDNSPAKQFDSVVDPGFVGTVHKLIIDATFTQTVTLNRSLLVTTETDIGGGKLAGNGELDIGDKPPPGKLPQYAAILNWTGGSITGANGSRVYLNTISTGHVSGTAAKILDGRTLIDDGYIDWTAGDIDLKNAAYFDISTGGTFDVKLPNTATMEGLSDGTANTLNVEAAGKLNSTVANGQLNLKLKVQINGSFTINQGDVDFAGKTFIAGLVTISTGSSAEFWNDLVFDSTAPLGSGQSTLTGLGEAKFQPGLKVHVTGTVNVGNVSDLSTSLDGTGLLIVNGVYDSYGSQWSGSGHVQIGTANAAVGQLNLKRSSVNPIPLGRTIDNYATIIWSAADDVKLVNGANINNNAGALIDLQSDQSLLSDGGTSQFTNKGVLQKSAGTGTSTIGVPFKAAGGRIETKTGKLDFANQKMTMLDGALQVDTGSTVAFDQGFEQDGGSVSVSGALTATGDVVEKGGTFGLVGGSVAANSVQVFSGAIFSGYGSVTANINNAGELDVTGGTLDVIGAYIQSAGITNLLGTELSVSGSVNEQGGQVNLTNGDLRAVHGLYVYSGATLAGSGVLNADVSLSGVLEVGGANAIGSLRIMADAPSGISGNLTESATAQVNMEIAGPNAIDQVFIDGMASLAGNLHVSLLNSYTPSHGLLLTLLTYGSRSGQFDSLSLPTYSGCAFVPLYDTPPHSFSLSTT